MQPGKTTSRNILLIGVSLVAICIAMPGTASAADMTPALIAKAPPMAQPPAWTLFVEGGGFWTSGGRHHVPFVGANDTIDVDTEVAPITGLAPKFGGTIAAGFDYRAPLSPWHVSGQFRYSRSGKDSRRAEFDFFPTTQVPTTAPITAFGRSSASGREEHWVADFAIGRDLGLGTDGQVKFGLRVAELSAHSSAALAVEAYSTAIPTFDASIAMHRHEEHRFLGFGPRIAVEGTAPLGGNWSLDYAAGGAALFGKRSISVRGLSTFDILGFEVSEVLADSISDSGVVWNVDASLGLAYHFSPNAKLTAGYRFDGYFNALPVVTASERLEHADRLFHGPFLRLTGKFGQP